MTEKPKCKLVGTDGNIFALLGRAQKELRRTGQNDKAVEMVDRATHSNSYEEALSIICEYVDAY